MTDPTPLGGQDEADIAARLQQAQAAAPLGVTSVDPAALIAAIEQLQKQVADLQSAKPSGRHPLLETAEKLASFVEHNHAGTPAHQLALDIADAAGNAVTSGNLSIVEKLAGRLSSLLHRNAPPPGDNWHHDNAVQIADYHLPDQLDTFVPAPAPLPSLAGAAPVKIAQGSVTG